MAMMKVLVVDDEVAITEALSGLLEGEGYQVTTADNGEQALAVMEVERPDVVITDVMMPVMDGREVVQRIRADARFDGVKIVLMSAATGLLGREVAGQDAFVRKPFSIDEIFDLLRRLSGEQGVA